MVSSDIPERQYFERNRINLGRYRFYSNIFNVQEKNENLFSLSHVSKD
jgi:hypothetical protein